MQDSKTTSDSTSANGLWSEYRHWVIGAIVLVVSILIWQAQGGETVFPESWISAFPFADKVNEFDRVDILDQANFALLTGVLSQELLVSLKLRQDTRYGMQAIH